MHLACSSSSKNIFHIAIMRGKENKIVTAVQECIKTRYYISVQLLGLFFKHLMVKSIDKYINSPNIGHMLVLNKLISRKRKDGNIELIDYELSFRI